MSAQTKKKRLGSHRRVAKQTETPKATERHVTDDASVAQCYIPEGNNESLSASSNPDGSQPDTQYPPSPELILNRRKLGSRRNKGQHVKDLVYHEPREEVEENNTGNEVQCEKQEEFGQESWQGTCASHDSYLFSAITPGYSHELQNPTATNCAEDVLGSLIPQSEGQTSDSKEMQEPFRVNSATGKESRESAKDTDLLRRDGDLKGNYSMSELHVESVIPGSSPTAEITSDKKRIEWSVEKATFSSQTDKLPADENQNEQSSQPLEPKPYDASGIRDEQTNTKFNSTLNRRKLGSSRRIKGRHHVKDPVGESDHETEEDVAGKMRGNEASETTELLFVVSEKDAERKEREGDTDLLMQWGLLQTSNLVSDPDVMSVGVSQQKEMQEIHVIDNSSAINDAKKNSEIHCANLTDQAGVEEVAGSEAFRRIPLVLQTKSQKKLSQNSEHDAIMAVTYDSSSNTESSSNSSPEVQILTTTPHTEAELGTFIVKSQNLEESHHESDTGFKMEISHRSVESPLEESDKSETLQSEEVHDTHSEDTVNEVQEQEVNPTQIQKMHGSDYSFESVVHDTAENSDTCSRNPEDQDEVSDTHPSDAVEKSTDDPAPTQEVNDSDDKQDELPTKQNNEEVLDQTHEDYYEYHTKKLLNTDVEATDARLGHVYENETQAEDEIKPISEQTSHQEKETLSEMEESESSLQILQTETNSPSDSELQDNSVKIDEQNDTDFNPIGNRRKLGSSRRHKGRRRVKGSGSESYHKPAEEDVEDRGNEGLQTRSQADSEHDAIMAVTYDSSSNTESSSNSSPEVQILTTTPHTEAELGTFIVKSQNLEESHHESDTGFKMEISHRSVESPLEESDKSETLQSEEVHDTHSEDTVNEVQEQEVNPTQIQKMHGSDYSFESVVHDTAENSDTCSRNLEDQDEVSDTNPSDAVEKSTDDPAPTQEVNDSDDKQDELPTKQNNEEVLDQTHEDYYEYHTKKPLNTNVEATDATLGHVYENETQAEDEIKPISEQTSHQEKETLSEMEESEYSLQTLQTETNSPSDSELHDNSVKIDEQNDTDFNPIGNRRKLGSSRRHKRRRHVKGSGSELENTQDNERLEKTEMTVVIETTLQETSMEITAEENKIDLSQTEEVGDNVKENAHASSSELTSISVYSSPALDQQVVEKTNVMEIPDEQLTGVFSVAFTDNEDTDLLRQVNDLVTESDFNSEGMEFSVIQETATEKSSHTQHSEPEGSVDQATISSPKEELSTNEEQNDLLSSSDVEGAEHSENDVTEVHEEEMKPTEMQEIHLDSSSESVIHDVTQNPDICSANLEDQEEVRDPYQSQLLWKSIDDPAPTQEVNDSDDKQDELPTKQNNEEVLDQTHEDYYEYHTKKLLNTDVEATDATLGHVYENEAQAEDEINPISEQTSHQEKETLSEMEESESSLQILQTETNSPSDSELQDNSVKIDEQNDNDFNPIGNRRKLGSSRRNKGRRHVKGSGSESYHKPAEEDVEDRGNEGLQTRSQADSEHDAIMAVTYDSSSNTESSSNSSPEVQILTTTPHTEAELGTFIVKSQNLEESHHESDTGFKMEISHRSVESPLEESDKSETLQSEEVHDTHSEDTVNEVQEQEVNPTQIQKMHGSDYSFESVVHDTAENSDTCSRNPEDQDEVSDTHPSDAVEKSTDDPAPTQEVNDSDGKQEQELQRAINAPSVSYPQDNSVKIDENNYTNFSPIMNRRKLGSSRRNRGRGHVEGSSIPETEVQQTSVETMLEEKNKSDLFQTEEDSDEVKENTHVCTYDLSCNKPVSDPCSATLIHDEEIPCVSSVTDIGKRKLGKHSHRQHNPTQQHKQGSVDQISSPKEELSKKQEQNEHFNPSEVRDAQQSDGALHEEEQIEIREMQKMHQFDSIQVEGSEIRSPLDSQVMDKSHRIEEETPSGFKLTGSRRKLGSSRRNKGRQPEPYPKHTEEVVENTWDDKEEILLGTKTSKQEELQEQAGPDFKAREKITKATSENIIDRGTILGTDITLNSDKNDTLKLTEDFHEEKKRLMKEAENLTPPTGYDTAKIHSIRFEEASVEIATDVQEPGHVEVSKECEEPANKDHAAQELNTSNEVTPADFFSAAQMKNVTWALDVGLEENLRGNPAVDASEESGTSRADACSMRNMEERNPEDDEILQGKVKKKKRKFGSTRMSQLYRKEEGETGKKDETIESNVDNKGDVRNLEVMQLVEDLSGWKEQQETNETSIVHDKRKMGQTHTPDLQSVESNVKPGADDSVVLNTDQSASNNEEDVNPIPSIHGVDVRDSEGNVDNDVKQPNEYASTEMQTTSVVVGRNRCSINQFLSPSTEETAQRTQKDEQSSEVIKVTQVQASISTEAVSLSLANLEKIEPGIREDTKEANNMNEGAHNTHFSSTKGRKKLSTTRRKLDKQSKGEDLDQEQEVAHEATGTNVGDVLTVSVSGMEEEELQLQSEDKGSDSEQRQVFETIGYRHIGESQVRSTDYLMERREAANQLTLDHLPAAPSASPKHDAMPESAAAGRRRRMGSNRSRGHQHFKGQTAGEGRVTDAGEGSEVTSHTKTAEEHTEESLGLDKILEVDENNQKSSSNISITKATVHTIPEGEQALKRATPVQFPRAEIHIVPESQNKISFAGADVRSKTYDVLMVGDSSVGKTSFMKRAQSGKFSLDIPASVGLDSCMWTVVVDGKPVVLQLWDTAGQERFHSITKQIFHRAQAFLLMYDITSSQTFTAISYWANCIQEGAPENVNILLLGNKNDHLGRQVETQEGESLAKEYNFEFMECSAATGENVIESLETVARMFSRKADTTEEIVVLHKEPPQKKRLGCC